MSEKEQTWQVFAGMCVTAIAALRIKKEDAPENVPDWIGQTTLALNHRADCACDHYMIHGEWPDLAQDLRLLVFLRFLYAATYINQSWRRGRPVVQAATREDYLLVCLNLAWYSEWDRWAGLYFSRPNDTPFDPWKLNS